MNNLCLFDLDHTLLPLDSDHEFGEFLIRQGLADAVEYRQRNDGFYQQYCDGTLVLGEYIQFTTSIWREMDAAGQQALQQAFMDEVVFPAMRPQAVELVERHRAMGDLIAIVTATNEFVTRPIADAFNVPELLAVKLVRDTLGRVTGDIDGVPSFREGKITRVEQWLAQQGRQLTDFDRVSFYSDSPNDLPLLERANDPVATNPSPALEAVAHERGWRILRLFA
ncbi:MAG: HAD-IB family hydrolase [Aquabacterium sp.]|uniref:HAD family hydrolase n=1 Tax=Aquabacterium sp. TaxID=1872578 RepID=UPI0025B836C2|nr:HAD-IB family hydrolase [Aquabacterium sp.]MBI5927426.1 HAD-IB family hydrolase [Aquabacterium sp.]